MGNKKSLEVKETFISGKGFLPIDAMKRCETITADALKKEEISKARQG